MTPRTDAVYEWNRFTPDDVQADLAVLARQLELELAEARSIAAHTHARNLELADLQSENESLKQELEMTRDLLVAAIADGGKR